MTTEIKKVKPQKQETARAWWIGSSLKEYTDAVQELSDRLKKESEQGKEMTEEDDDIQDYKKPWVGLTQEELYEIYDASDDGSSPCGVCGACSKCKLEVSIARAIQSKLKEKNT